LRKTAKGVLEGHPAFILGNGPMLPRELSVLEDFFTVGVNRILEVYDPTVVMWLDRDVTPYVRPRLAESETLPLRGGTAGRDLRPVGTLQGPETYIDCKNSGVSAAYWAMDLGCRPIYLVGMSATYEGGKTDFYGRNRHHVPSTLLRLRRAVNGILAHPNVFAIRDQEHLNELCDILRPCARGRRWYLDRLARIRIGKRAPSARR